MKLISDWLKENAYLQETIDDITGEKTTMLTDKGREKGIYLELRHSRFGHPYEVVMYSQKAQEWIVEEMRALLSDNCV